MAGISDKALKSQYAENKYRYNGGSELANKEFTDGSGLEAYDANFRMYDPQIGRFWQVDPLGELDESWSPYSFSLDNPISFNDPLGLTDSVPGLKAYAPAPVIRPPAPAQAKPIDVDRALIGTPPGGVNAPSAPTAPPDISIGEPGPEVSPLGRPEPNVTPLGGPGVLGTAALTIIATVSPLGGPSFPNGDEMFRHNHPEFSDPKATPSAKNKELNNLYLVRYGEYDSREKLEADATNAQSAGFPHGVSTFLRSKPPAHGRYALLLEVMRRFEIKKTGGPDHFTVVLPIPVTQQAALDFNLMFIKR